MPVEFNAINSGFYNRFSLKNVDLPAMETKDSNGTILSEGDSVLVIKTLKVKGSSGSLDRGTVVKNIKLTENPEEVEARINGSVIVLKACFLKKR